MFLRDAKALIKTLYKRQIETGVRFSLELESGPGLGKSQMVEQVAKELSREQSKGGIGEDMGFKPFFLSTIEQPDVRGFGLPGKDSAGEPIMRYTKAPWVVAPEEPTHGILFLDEFRQAQHDVQKPAAELLLNGRVGDSQLPITWMVIAASNREKDRSGVQRELAFISNRRMLITLDPHLDSWVEWAEARNIHYAAVAYAKAHPADVFGDSVPDKGGPFCSPRSFVQMSYLIGAMPIEMFGEAAGGLIGEGAAAKFVGYLRVVDQQPKWEEILANPEKCRLPDKDRPDANYATMQMIAYRCDKDSAIPAFKYLKRMPKEYQAAGLKSALAKPGAAAMVKTPDFSKWLAENRELVTNANLLRPKN